MNDDTVIQVEQLAKRFKIYANPWDRAREWLTRRRYHTEFWALRDISFELKAGEIFGIIGRNGAGKSTLLKILSGVLMPTGGSFFTDGRVLSLLELGGGFNPELTGCQNLFHSSQMLGLPRTYVEQHVAEIEAFAELDDYFDRPFKLYSSGMRARLGFSLFAFLECDVLILDEILSVGDIFFRQKCYERLDQLVARDTSIILVTHSMPTVQQYCHRAMVLDQGRVVFLGNPGEAVSYYSRLSRIKPSPSSKPDNTTSWNGAVKQPVSNLKQKESQPVPPSWPTNDVFIDLSRATVGGGKLARCLAVAVTDEQGQAARLFEQGEWLYLFAEFEILADGLGVPVNTYAIVNERNLLIHNKSTLQQMSVGPEQISVVGSRLRYVQKVKLDLMPGEYSLKLNLAALNIQTNEKVESLSLEALRQQTNYLVHLDKFASFTITRRRQGLELLHYGICNLPGECWLNVSQPTLQSSLDGLSPTE